MSKVLSALTFTQNTRMIMLGLDAAGKTTILYKLKLGDLVTTIPTMEAQRRARDLQEPGHAHLGRRRAGRIDPRRHYCPIELDSPNAVTCGLASYARPSQCRSLEAL